MTQYPSHPPCFVFGALRSGTTMFRLMLNSHARITNPGEVDFLFDFLHPDPDHPTGWAYDTEAMARHRIFRAHQLEIPAGSDGLDLLYDLIAQFQRRSEAVLTLNVHRNAGKIAQLFPDARFIHLLRDPRDVARSSIAMGWAGNSYYGVRHWIRTEQNWAEAHPHIPPQQVLTLRFENLMADLEGELHRVCGFLDVPFTPQLLEYHRNSTYAPPDPNIAEQWRRKARPREVALIEAACGEMLSACGYVPSQTPAHPGRLERGVLLVQNRVVRWRFNLRKFGPALFFKFHFSRHLGSKTMRREVRAQMDRKITEGLK